MMPHIEYIEKLDNIVREFRQSNPDMGLPEHLFHFISRSTPIVNIDLLIQDSNNRSLLAWRDDAFSGSGWHIPGGIVRYKETMLERVEHVANLEIGRKVQYDIKPIAFNEVILPHNTRGHFISFLYLATLDSNFEPENTELTKKDQGYLQWHDTCPNNLVKVHNIYRPYIEGTYHENKKL